MFFLGGGVGASGVEGGRQTGRWHSRVTTRQRWQGVLPTTWPSCYHSRAPVSRSQPSVALALLGRGPVPSEPQCGPAMPLSDGEAWLWDTEPTHTHRPTDLPWQPPSQPSALVCHARARAQLAIGMHGHVRVNGTKRRSRRGQTTRKSKSAASGEKRKWKRCTLYFELFQDKIPNIIHSKSNVNLAFVLLKMVSGLFRIDVGHICNQWNTVDAKNGPYLYQNK